MLVTSFVRKVVCLTLFSLALSGCFVPPFNNFNRDKSTAKKIATGAVIGAGTGAIIGGVAGNAPAGVAIGGIAGAAVGMYYSNQRVIIKELQKQDIQFTKYGDSITLIVPTDRYFLFNSPRLNDLCYPGLNNIVKLLRYYPHTPIYVAGFTDDVGTHYHKKKLSQAQAETMITFLWAYDIPAQRLHAEGYADQNDIGNNKLIHGSAYNRRIEIQWLTNTTLPKPPPYICATK